MRGRGLLMHLVEARRSKSLVWDQICRFFGHRLTGFNQSWCVAGNTESMHLKIRMIKVCSIESLPLNQKCRFLDNR